MPPLSHSFLVTNVIISDSLIKWDSKRLSLNSLSNVNHRCLWCSSSKVKTVFIVFSDRLYECKYLLNGLQPHKGTLPLIFGLNYCNPFRVLRVKTKRERLTDIHPIALEEGL